MGGRNGDGRARRALARLLARRADGSRPTARGLGRRAAAGGPRTRRDRHCRRPLHGGRLGGRSGRARAATAAREAAGAAREPAPAGVALGRAVRLQLDRVRALRVVPALAGRSRLPRARVRARTGPPGRRPAACRVGTGRGRARRGGPARRCLAACDARRALPAAGSGRPAPRADACVPCSSARERPLAPRTTACSAAPGLDGTDEAKGARMSKAIPAAAVALGALALVANAAAHSSISPAAAKTKTLQPFTLELQAEKEDAVTTRVEVTFPEGFDVETFAASPGWKRTEVSEGGGEAPVRRVYSDGEVEDWSGPEGSEHPAAFVEGVSSFGGDSSSTLTVVALVVGGI